MAICKGKGMIKPLPKRVDVALSKDKVIKLNKKDFNKQVS